MLNNSNAKGMKKLMVAIISLMLILVTTIGYSAGFVFAEENEPTQEMPAPDQTVPDQPAPDQAAPDQTVPDQPATDQPAPDQTVPDQPATDQPAPDQPSTDQAAPDQPATDQPAQDQQSEETPPQVSATSYIVMSGSTSQIVNGSHYERKMQPGSITLLMTAMVVIDNMYDDDELRNIVDITPELAAYGSTFKEGESVTVGDLLNAMLVGADCQAAEALASYSTSSREIFVNEMNSKCMELDIMDTQFTNPGGENETMQYSTAKDCAVIAQAAIRYQKVKDAFKKKSVIVKASTKETERDIEITNSDPLTAGSEDQLYKYSRGGIRGILGETMQYAAVSSKDGMEMIAVLMDSNPEPAAAEAKALLEYGDAHAEKNVIVKAGRRQGTARVRGGVWTRVAGYTETKGYAYVPPEGSEKLIQTQVVMLDNLEAPLKEGDKVGEFRIYVADELKGTVDLVTNKDVPVGWPPSKYYISNLVCIIAGVILFLIVLFFLRVLHVKRRRIRRAEAIRREKIKEIARRQMEIDEDRRRRNWNATGYDPLPPRTTDLRRENMNQALKSEEKERK